MIQFREYMLVELSRFELDRSRGSVLLEFGADWCGFCKVAQPAIAAALSRRPDVWHVKVADGPGKPLGRSYQVKLWPTLIVLLDGAEVARLVAPPESEIAALLKAVEPPMHDQALPSK
jgi:thioredoxin 1